MAEILVIPARPHGLGQASRLHADLASAHARGTDLGPRAPHIHADGERLLELTCALERAIADLDLSPIGLGLLDPAVREDLRRFVTAAQSLADTARRFPTTL